MVRQAIVPLTQFGWWCGLVRKWRLREDQGGQMMLLAAFLLVIGFIAMGSMLARVNQLPGETLREQDSPLLLEIEALDQSLESIIDNVTRDEGAGTADFEAELLRVMRHLQDIEAGHGFAFRYVLGCSNAADPTTGFLDVTLSDGIAEVTVRTGPFDRPSC